MNLKDIFNSIAGVQSIIFCISLVTIGLWTSKDLKIPFAILWAGYIVGCSIALVYHF